ncbi:DinB family protein [Pedobacter sp.]
MTYEFHHKGQVMTMARLLGNTSPDTDVMRF